MRSVNEWKILLRAALRDAMRSRESDVLAAIRETLAAIDNAEAADASLAPSAQSGPIAGAVEGLGAGEIPRRVLGPNDVAAIVEREVRERREAAKAYVDLGREDAAGKLHRQADLLESLLQQQAADGSKDS